MQGPQRAPRSYTLSLQVLSRSVLMAPGGVTRRGSMFWRNQPGPTEKWLAPKGMGHALRETVKGARYTNIFVMGMPKSISEKYIAEFEDALRACGCEATASVFSLP